MLNFGFYNMDCMEGMKQFPDDYFNLAIVDPPYGSGLTEGGGCEGWFAKYRQDNLRGGVLEQVRSEVRQVQESTSSEMRERGVSRTGGTWAAKFSKKSSRGMWLPNSLTLKNCFASHVTRLSGGGNYFDLPPTRCFLIWRKTNVPEQFSMAMAEYAWTSFNENAKVFDFSAVGQPDRFHPTQKPVELYKWIIHNYAKDGDIILDTHVGSASSLIACRETGHKYVGFEIDPDYYELAKKRLDEAEAQVNIFDLMNGGTQ